MIISYRDNIVGPVVIPTLSWYTVIHFYYMSLDSTVNSFFVKKSMVSLCCDQFKSDIFSPNNLNVC